MAKEVKVEKPTPTEEQKEQKEGKKGIAVLFGALTEKVKTFSLRKKEDKSEDKEEDKENKNSKLLLGFVGVGLAGLAVLGILSGKLPFKQKKQAEVSSQSYSYEKAKREKEREKARKKESRAKENLAKTKEGKEDKGNKEKKEAGKPSQSLAKKESSTAEKDGKKEDISRVNLNAFQRFYLSLLNEEIRKKEEELKKLKEEIKKLEEERLKLSSPLVIKIPQKPKTKEEKVKKEVLFPIKVEAVLCNNRDCVAITNFGVLKKGEKIGSEVVEKISSDCVITNKRKLCVGQ